MTRFTDENGEKKSMTSSIEAYKKLSFYEDQEDENIIPEKYVYDKNKDKPKKYYLQSKDEA